MKLLDLKDLTLEHFKAFSEPGELTPEERAEVERLFMAQLKETDLQQVDWDQATPFEDFLRELKEEQRQWDKQKQ
jgi:hypothetical protein